MKISNFQFILKILFLVFLFNSVVAFADDDDIVFIPDSIFKEKLLNDWGAQEWVDKNRDGEIQRWEAERYTGRFYMVLGGVKSLVGIKAFKNVYNFELTITDADSLDISGMENLVELHLYGKHLKYLNTAACKSLQSIDCLDNNLLEINLTGCTNLTYMQCALNQLINIDVSELSNLRSLLFAYNQVEEIKLSQNTIVDVLGSFNKLKKIDLSGLPNLDFSPLNDNLLEELNLKNGNNINFNSKYMDITNNPNLKCVEVDDPNYSYENWLDYFDEGVIFSEDCSNSIMDEQNKSFFVYPNPASDILTIKRLSSSEEELRINDMNGKLRYKKTIHHGEKEIQIDISKFPVGAYIIEINEQSELIIIER